MGFRRRNDRQWKDGEKLQFYPGVDIQQAKNDLKIGYGHTSHGSQLIGGMRGLIEFANNGHLGYSNSENLFEYTSDGTHDSLLLYEGDGYGNGYLNRYAGYYPNWVDETYKFLNKSENYD